MRALTTMPTTEDGAALGAVFSTSKGMLLLANVTGGARSLVPVRKIGERWYRHPVGTLTWDSAGSAGGTTDPKRYERIHGDTTSGYWHVLDLGGDGTLGEVELIPADFS